MSDAELHDTPESWPVVSSDPIYSDEWVVTVRRDWLTTLDGDGEPFRRLVVGHPGAAMVLAIDEDERVVCVRQYRHPAQLRMVEIPAGVLDHGDEEPLDVAVRELREEAGLAADEWTPLVRTYPSPGLSAECFHFFLARGLHDVGHGDFVHEHEEAAMEVVRVPFDELLEGVLTGRLSNGGLVTAVLAYAALRSRGSGT